MKITPQVLKDFLQARYYFQDSPCFVSKILTEFPQFRYQGPAYRAVVLGVDEKFIKKVDRFIFTSFAKTFKGVHSFLMNYHQEGAVDVNQVVLVEAKITGLDLGLVINYLENQGLILDQFVYQLKKEEEIIALEVSNVQKVPGEVLWWDQLSEELHILRLEIGDLLDRGLVCGREWADMKNTLNGLNFLNHLLKINDTSLTEADIYLSTVTPEDNPEAVGQKLHELGFVIPKQILD